MYNGCMHAAFMKICMPEAYVFCITKVKKDTQDSDGQSRNERVHVGKSCTRLLENERAMRMHECRQIAHDQDLKANALPEEAVTLPCSAILHAVSLFRGVFTDPDFRKSGSANLLLCNTACGFTISRGFYRPRFADPDLHAVLQSSR